MIIREIEETKKSEELEFKLNPTQAEKAESSSEDENDNDKRSPPIKRT